MADKLIFKSNQLWLGKLVVERDFNDILQEEKVTLTMVDKYCVSISLEDALRLSKQLQESIETAYRFKKHD